MIDVLVNGIASLESVERIARVVVIDYALRLAVTIHHHPAVSTSYDWHRLSLGKHRVYPVLVIGCSPCWIALHLLRIVVLQIVEGVLKHSLVAESVD